MTVIVAKTIGTTSGMLQAYPPRQHFKAETLKLQPRSGTKIRTLKLKTLQALKRIVCLKCHILQ